MFIVFWYTQILSKGLEFRTLILLPGSRFLTRCPLVVPLIRTMKVLYFYECGLILIAMTQHGRIQLPFVRSLEVQQRTQLHKAIKIFVKHKAVWKSFIIAEVIWVSFAMSNWWKKCQWKDTTSSGKIIFIHIPKPIVSHCFKSMPTPKRTVSLSNISTLTWRRNINCRKNIVLLVAVYSVWRRFLDHVSIQTPEGNSEERVENKLKKKKREKKAKTYCSLLHVKTSPLLSCRDCKSSHDCVNHAAHRAISYILLSNFACNLGTLLLFTQKCVVWKYLAGYLKLRSCCGLQHMLHTVLSFSIAPFVEYLVD